MLRWTLAVLASAVSGLVGAVLILTNTYPDEGPWLPISPSHGIHIGDVVIVALWAGLTVLLVRWARRVQTR